MEKLINFTFESKWHDNLSNEEYHADKSAINSTNLKQILKSPASFLASLNEVKEETQAMRFGSMVHMAILEYDKFKNTYVEQPEFGDMRKKENKEAKENWLKSNEGKIAVSSQEYSDLIGIAEAISNRPDALALLKNGKTEQAGFFVDQATGIVNKIKPDFLSYDSSILVDIKTTQDCTMNEFSKSIWNFRYDFQMAMYSEGVKVITGKRPDYHVFIALEKKAPYEVGIYIADMSVLEKGLQDYHKALAKLKSCITTNTWPKYQTNLETINLPAWAY